MCKWIVDADQLEMNDFNNEIEILYKTDVILLPLRYPTKVVIPIACVINFFRPFRIPPFAFLVRFGTHTLIIAKGGLFSISTLSLYSPPRVAWGLFYNLSPYGAIIEIPPAW